jgi:hypothetical protein
MMCPVPEDVAYASYRAVEGVVTPNGALHGTILEYNCNIGYRYNNSTASIGVRVLKYICTVRSVSDTRAFHADPDPGKNLDADPDLTERKM